MSISTIYILGTVFGLAATILACFFIVPENKRPSLNKFGVFLHDLFNFKSLWLEKILQFFYILSTVTVVLTGFFMLFWTEEYTTYSYWSYGYETHYEWVGYYGLIFLIAGPVIIRIVYEASMMLILAVKNIIEINNKLGHGKIFNNIADINKKLDKICNDGSENEVKEEPKKTPPTKQFCAFCGNLLDENGKCTKCNHQF